MNDCKKALEDMYKYRLTLHTYRKLTVDIEETLRSDN